LKNLGLFSTCSRERSLIQRLVQLLKKNDMIFGISHSGNTEEVVSAVSLAREYGAFAMGMTNFSPSPLTEAARTTLITGVPEKLLSSYSCQARMSQLAILELILYELSEVLIHKLDRAP
jgi:DNA-binding MurR/RpiR family transcriptional regulator